MSHPSRSPFRFSQRNRHDHRGLDRSPPTPMAVCARGGCVRFLRHSLLHPAGRFHFVCFLESTNGAVVSGALCTRKCLKLTAMDLGGLCLRRNCTLRSLVYDVVARYCSLAARPLLAPYWHVGNPWRTLRHRFRTNWT